MIVRVAAFGRLGERFGGAAGTPIDLAGATTLRGAVREIEARSGGLGPGVAVALNGRIPKDDPEIRDGDEIVLLPPVSGG